MFSVSYKINGEPALLTTDNIILLNKKPVWPDNFTPMPSSEVVSYIVNHAGARPIERD
jgi:hypothetical protein